MATARKVLVVGGGIAGLTLAAALGRAGHRADVVEIEPAWNVLGVGISLTGPTLRALRSIGLMERCLEVSFGFSRVLLFDAHESPAGAIEMPSLNGPDYPAMVAIRRRVLHDLLLRAAIEAGADIRLGLTVDVLAETSDGIAATFTDGSEATYDLVVGADGFHSQIRGMALGDTAEPKFTGLAVWRATMTRAPEVACMRMFYGPRNKAGLNPVAPDEMFLFLVQPIADGHRPAAEALPGLLKAELADYDGPLLAYVRERIDDPAKVDYRPMDALLLPAPWHRGRVLVIGDAAHTTTPHLATGAGIAIEDAVVLAEELATDRPVAACLDGFMARRYERCRLVVETSITLGEWEKDPAIPAADHAALMQRTFARLAEPL